MTSEEITSALLIVWSENGNYLRYASTLNAALIAMSALILSIYGFSPSIAPTEQAAESSALETKGILSISILTFLFISVATSLISFIPTTKKNKYTNVKPEAMKHKSAARKSETSSSCELDSSKIFYYHIANYSSPPEYLQAFISTTQANTHMQYFETTRLQEDIADQIWNIVLIARRKTQLFTFGLVMAGIALLLTIVASFLTTNGI